MANQSVISDAKVFGQSVKAGGLYLGVIVARNVEPASPGRPPKNVPKETNSSGKVSMNEFAKLSGVSLATVQRYYRAYEELSKAEAGFEPPDQLQPGVDPAELENASEETTSEMEDLWKKCVRRARNGDEDTKSQGTEQKSPKEEKPKRLSIDPEDEDNNEPSSEEVEKVGAELRQDAQIDAVSKESAEEATFELLTELIQIRQDIERAKEAMDLAVMYAPVDDERSSEQLDLIENYATAILSALPKFKSDEAEAKELENKEVSEPQQKPATTETKK